MIAVGEAAAINLKCTKTLLANYVSIFFINGKLTDINGLRRLRNHPFWQVTFQVAPLVIPLFSEDLVTFITSFISLVVNVILQPFTSTESTAYLSLIKLYSASKRALAMLPHFSIY